ncbi:glycosyl hydrolase [Prosthecochloris sp. GSB1]|uniref:glycosyltransferase family 2 protein n=1 Tax=Prosthecochloris sp. GSB1 TaxID=281093 RepID=UPI000B8C8E69|nr:glycosyltransferase family 2 protein [Prosthecochloris sp. GSB1]ASQ91362.1 glycosyl hydrolase [Prosthecochloris sp. GSB1]
MSAHRGTVWVIVVNWNNASDTLRCLASLEKAGVPGMRVLLVDNASTDGSVERVAERFAGVEILARDVNDGFGGGCNAGYERARSGGAEYLVFLNNDTVVDEGFLEPLLEPLRRGEDIGMTVPRIYFMEQSDRLWYAGGEVNLFTGRFAHRGIRQRDADRFASGGETQYATGCCMAMRAADFGESGGFDSRFSLYGEDVDLSLRFRARGKRILYVPESKVWHRVSASVGGELHFRKLWKKQRAHFRLLLKYRARSGVVLSLILAPVRLLYGAAAVTLFRLRAGTEPYGERGA